MAHSVASEPVVSRKTFSSPSGATRHELFDQRGALLAGEDVVVSSPLLTWSMMAWRTSGAPWPALVTSTPLDQSSQRLPYLS